MTIMDKEDNELINNKKKKKKKRVVDSKNDKTRKKQPILFYKLLSFLLVILSVVLGGYVIYEEIFPVFYLIPGIALFLLIMFFIVYVLNKEKLRRWIKNLFSFIAFIFIILEILMLVFGTKTLKFVSNLTDTGYRVETYGVYVLSDSSYNKLSDLDNKKITYLDHEDDTNIREALSKIEKKISVESDYSDNIESLVDELINGNTDAILFDSSYDSVLSEEYPEKYGKIKLIEEFDIVDMVDTIQSDVDITKDPFAVYISGIDTSGNVASKARSDVNIILAVNPKTKNILMVNTPRDFYVTLHTKQKKDKLTHAGLYGVEESLNTLADLYDVDIDYYARINFTSFVKIVDALGGITVTVPKDFCEQNSKRSKADGDLICLKKGTRTLKGEEALALARHRHTLPNGDRDRGNNQMMILEAIINKAMSPSIITKYNSLLSALEGKVTTNMQTNEIIKFINKNKNNTSGWTFTSVSATGTDSTGVCYATGSGKAYVMQPDEESVNKAKKTLRNLFKGETDITVNTETTTTTTTTSNVVKTTTKK